ncbi:MAG: hypothetical protein AAF412_12240, partial [Pseudomonadota bacterium]
MYNHQQNQPVLAFINFSAWVVVFVGLIAAGIGAYHAPEPPFGSNIGLVMTYMMPGMFVTIMGIIAVVLSAIGLATIDNARSNEELLVIMRRFVQQQNQSGELALRGKATRKSAVAASPGPVQKRQPDPDQEPARSDTPSARAQAPTG